MRQPNAVYPLPERLSPDLAQVLDYWEGLKRGEAEIPFWDDVKLTALPHLGRTLAIVDVFEGPERFRYSIVGADLADGQDGDVAGRFLDEAELGPPLDFMRAQCAATVEAASPTYFAPDDEGYGRLVLPLWGEGQIRMLLVAADNA